MIKKYRYFIFPLLTIALFALIVPFGVFAQQDESTFFESSGLVPCGTTGTAPCTFKDLFVLAINVIKFLIFTVAIPLCSGVIVWAGIKLALNPSNATLKGEVKKMMWAAVFGLALALGSYLIVDTVLTTFTDKTLDSIQQI